MAQQCSCYKSLPSSIFPSCVSQGRSTWKAIHSNCLHSHMTGKVCAASPRQMCRMRCSRIPTCPVGQCAMRRGNCCAFKCAKMSGSKPSGPGAKAKADAEREEKAEAQQLQHEISQTCMKGMQMSPKIKQMYNTTITNYVKANIGIGMAMSLSPLLVRIPALGGALLGKTPKPQDIKVTSFAPLKLNIALRGGSAAFKKACAKIPGSSYGCMKASLHDSFKMHSIRGKVGFMPVTIHMSGSHCLPAMCTQKDVNAIVKFMNAVIASEIKKTGIAAGSPILGNKGMKTRIDIKDCGHSDHVSSKTKCGCYASRRNMEKFCESGRFRNPKSCMSGPMANICHWGPEENAKCAKAAAPFKKHS